MCVIVKCLFNNVDLEGEALFAVIHNNYHTLHRLGHCLISDNNNAVWASSPQAASPNPEQVKTNDENGSTWKVLLKRAERF